MKLLIFAHTPPPHHGQSYMVELMLGRMGGDRRKQVASASPQAGAGLGIECYHVNARLSQKLEDIGDFRIGKFLLLLGYCVQAIWCRFRYGVTDFYYIPAPGKTSALYRDWLVLFLCRPFFKRLILHWHASGLGNWLETVAGPRSRLLTYRAARQADLSVVLSNYGRADAEKLYPLRVAVVGNGIPDPCPAFAEDVLPRRRARLEARRLILAGKTLPPDLAARAGAEPQVFDTLFLGHCTREKGLFDAVAGAALAQRKLAADGSPLALRLTVAGRFVSSAEEAEFRQLCATAGPGSINYVGFVEGQSKKRWLEAADGFCFPSHIESFGLVLAEAMAFGLPIVTARCGAVPEVVGCDYPGLVDARCPEQIADALLRIMTESGFQQARQRFEDQFTVDRHAARLATAFKSIDQYPPGHFSRPAIISLDNGQSAT